MQLLFGELFPTRQFHGVKQRWRDVVAAGIHLVGLNDHRWYSGPSILGRLCIEVSLYLQCSLLLLGLLPHPVLLSVSVKENFTDKGNLTRHSKFCMQPLPRPDPSNMNFHCCCGQSWGSYFMKVIYCILLVTFTKK